MGTDLCIRETKYLVKRKRGRGGKEGERWWKREGGETERFVLD